MRKVLVFFDSEVYEPFKERLREGAKQYFDDIISYEEKDIDKEFYDINQKNILV